MAKPEILIEINSDLYDDSCNNCLAAKILGASEIERTFNYNYKIPPTLSTIDARMLCVRISDNQIATDITVYFNDKPKLLSRKLNICPQNKQ